MQSLSRAQMTIQLTATLQSTVNVNERRLILVNGTNSRLDLYKGSSIMKMIVPMIWRNRVEGLTGNVGSQGDRVGEWGQPDLRLGCAPLGDGFVGAHVTEWKSLSVQMH